MYKDSMTLHGFALSILLVLRDWFLNPLLYAGFLLAFWDLRRTSSFERKFFGIRATRPLRLTIFRGLQGLLVGVVVSGLLTALGVMVNLWEVATVTVLSIVLAAIQLRFVSPVYSVAILSIISWFVNQFAKAQIAPGSSGIFPNALRYLSEFHTVDWAAIICGVLVAEAFLVYTVGRRSASPVVTVSKRGRGIGALLVQLAFMVPLVLPTTGSLWSSPSYAGSSIHFLWTSAVSTFGLLGIPVLVGFSGLFDNLRPRVAVHQTALADLVAAVIAAAGAYLGVAVQPIYAVLAPLVVVAVREAVRWWLDHRQSLADPLFAPADQGVMVLAVLPDSWAARLGVQPGDTITRVNSVPVHSQYDLHFALNQNPAYAKMEVVDTRGEIRFVNHTVYAGERTQLGVICAPDGQSPRFVKAGGSGLLQSLYANMMVVTDYNQRSGDGRIGSARSSTSNSSGVAAAETLAMHHEAASTEEPRLD